MTRFLLAEPDNPGSLANAAKAIHVNLRSSRDVLPQVLYERTNDLCHVIRRGIGTRIGTGSRQAFLSGVEQRLLAIAGTMEGSLSHGAGYLIARTGMLIERADMTSRILDVRAATLPLRPAADHFEPFDEREWMSVLRSLAAFQMYRQHVHRPINGPDVLGFLLLDADLPRAYRFCLDHIGICLEQLGGHREPLDALGRLQRRLAEPDLAALSRDAKALHEFLDDLQGGLIDVAQGIAVAYFPPAEPSADPAPDEPAA